jgi:hypothetical protein
VSEPVEVLVWEPPVFLGRLRHGFANLLVPAAVAAELLDDGSDVAAGLARSVERMRRASTRVKQLAELAEPTTEILTLEELARRCGLPVPDPASARPALVAADADRLRRNLVDEMSANGATLSVRPCPALHAVVVRSTLTGAAIPAAIASWAAVPMTVSAGGVGVALACREAHLHGGRVFIEGDSIDFVLPYAG